MPTSFTLYFDGRFWVGVLERRERGYLQAAKVTFGSRPSDPELYDWFLAHGNDLIRDLSTAVRVPDGAPARDRRRNPKRALREAARAAKEPQTSTAAQRALAADREEKARAAAVEARRQSRDRAEETRAKKRARARAKHRGR